MINYREATLQDAGNIARLHALSWQQHYRGILHDDFLDNQVRQNRQELWHSRLQNPTENQFVVVAEEDNTLYGFACVFAGADPVWGALLDNLHVLSIQKGQGIGMKLIKSAASWVYSKHKNQGLYLWVYTKNTKARGFYERMGGINQEEVLTENPGGGQALICRYVWKDITQLTSLP